MTKKTDTNSALNEEAIKYLVKTVTDSDLEELEYTCEDFSLKLCRGGKKVVQSAVQVNREPELPIKTEVAYKEEYITAPMVGKIYFKSKPDEPDFVREGDEIKAGQVVCIIEAMKVMNQIKATKNCVVKKILVKTNEPVEFGQKIMVIE